MCQKRKGLTMIDRAVELTSTGSERTLCTELQGNRSAAVGMRIAARNNYYPRYSEFLNLWIWQRQGLTKRKHWEVRYWLFDIMNHNHRGSVSFFGNLQYKTARQAWISYLNAWRIAFAKDICFPNGRLKKTVENWRS